MSKANGAHEYHTLDVEGNIPRLKEFGRVGCEDLRSVSFVQAFCSGRRSASRTIGTDQFLQFRRLIISRTV